MSLRAAILATLAILGIALLGVLNWQNYLIRSWKMNYGRFFAMITTSRRDPCCDCSLGVRRIRGRVV